MSPAFAAMELGFAEKEVGRRGCLDELEREIVGTKLT